MKNNNETFLYDRIVNKNSDINVWLGFPAPYSFSMSSLGYLWMFKTLDQADGINVSRICSDTVILPSNKPDLLGFSFSFDMDFVAILSMMEKNKIKFKSKDRDDKLLIFAGGPVVTANPEPYKDFFDFFIIGDGEEINLKAVETYKANINKSKYEILEILSEIEGIYVPIFPKKVKKLTQKLSKCIYTPILSNNAFFKDTFIIEMSRGCSNRCGFCLASYLNLPLRTIEYTQLLNTIDLGLKYTNKIALLGAQISAHPHFLDVCDYIYNKIKSGHNIEMSLSSLRVDAVCDNVIKTLTAAGQKNTTLAIEAGSERLRKVINKHLNEEQIFKAVEIAKRNGLKGVKFYGMIGLPTETYDDLQSMIMLAKKLKETNKGFDISFGFSSFVPKPHTPFQWIGRESIKSLEDKSNFLKKEFHKIGININISSIKWDYWQAVLSRGDDKLTDFLIEVYKQGGKLGAFKSAARMYNINTDYYATDTYDYNKTLPWDFIELLPNKDFLIEENKRLINQTSI